MVVPENIDSVLGGIVGFALAQLANLVSWVRWWVMRPVLGIELVGDNSYFLSHSEQDEEGNLNPAEVYGFRVRNCGRRISHKVRFQIFKTECRENGTEPYKVMSDGTFNLSAYNQANREPGPTEVTLVPGASIDVELARWVGDEWDLVVPSVSSVPEYYEEMFGSVGDFRFSVVTFDESGSFDKKEIIVRTEDVRQMITSGEWLKPRVIDPELLPNFEIA